LNVIVVNPHAKRLRANLRIKEKIHARFASYATIIDADDRHDVIGELNTLRDRELIDVIYVVGGDGTFSHILNWITELPVAEQPSLMCVGGGQFCYMCRFHGFRSKNPVKNLTQIFSAKLRLLQKEWQPLCVTDSLTQHRRHAAVIANGVVSDILKWYEDAGKGGILTILRIILMAILSITSDWLRRVIGRINLLHGTLSIGTSFIRPKAYAGVTFSAIPKLLASCRPFHGRRNPYQFYAIAYWGGLRRLALAAPFIWFGITPFWIKRFTFNNTVQRAVVETDDPRLLLDGDLFVLPGSGKHDRADRHLTITTGAPITILVVNS
jgi:hypothetical protein